MIVIVDTVLIALLIIGLAITYRKYTNTQNSVDKIQQLETSIESLTSRVDQLDAPVTSYSSTISSLRAQVESQSSQISILNIVNNNLVDEVNIQKIPGIIKSKYTPTSAIEYVLNPFIDKLKVRYSVLSTPIKLSKSTIASVLSKKIQLPDMTVISTSKISGSKYNAELRLRFPVGVDEIPVLASVTNLTGNITIYIDIILNMQVDTNTRDISNVSYKNYVINF
jgi:outer membrane murein-binding lipoprotein Lpp